MAMGQFIDASLYLNEGLQVLARMPDTPRRQCLEIGMHDTPSRVSRRDARLTIVAHLPDVLDPPLVIVGSVPTHQKEGYVHCL